MSKAPHFLVVDDDAESLATIVEYLKAMGHEKVTTARDGAEAIRIIEHDSSITFIISDWDMPLMNGLTLLQRVRSHPSRAHMPFLIATSPISHESEKVILAAESLVDAYVIKPFRSDVLKTKIEKVLETPVHGPQKQVVVVDDDNDARAMVVEYLTAMGFKDVVGFPDAKTALRHLQARFASVGLIVSDWEMPEMTGIDLLKVCKSSQALAEIPFLMITSQESLERVKVLQAARANVDQYLLKPFPSAELKKRVEHMLERARTRGEVRKLVAEGLAHLEHSRHARALENFEAALALDPAEDIALRGAGDALLKTKGVETALPYYKKAVEANPVNPVAYLRLAFAYEQIGWIDKAIALLQTATAQISFHPDLHFHLGRMFNKKGIVPLAKAEFEKTLELQLDHQEARLMLEMVNQARGRGDT